MSDNCRHIPELATKDEETCRLRGQKSEKNEILTPEEITALLGGENAGKKRFVVTGGLGYFILSLLKRIRQ